MSDKINLRLRSSSLNDTELYDGFSKVVLVVSDYVEYESGTDSGRTLTLSCPWGTQALADSILQRVKGKRYQTFSASGAQIDPSVELGDFAAVGNICGGIFEKSISLGPLYSADIAAPGEEEIDYQFEYKSPLEREVKRNYKNLSSELNIQAGKISLATSDISTNSTNIANLTVKTDGISGTVSQEITDRKNDVDTLTKNITAVSAKADGISASVTQEISDRNDAVSSLQSQLNLIPGQISASVSGKADAVSGDFKTFGWCMSIGTEANNFKDAYWEVASNYKRLFRVDINGAEVCGKITAESGTIGGFDIESNYLSYNKLVYGSKDVVNGAYIGQLGIQLGQNFKVDMYGNLYAASGTFTGAVRAGSIQYGTDAAGTDWGTFSGAGLTANSVSGGQYGKISYGGITSYNVNEAINDALGYASAAHNFLSGTTEADYIYVKSMSLDKKKIYRGTIQYTNWDGTHLTANVVKWTD